MGDIADLKDKYAVDAQGRPGRIFLIGNGPSLTPAILEKLTGEYTFGMNAISFIYPKTEWRPSFYLCVSSNAEKPLRQVFFYRSIALGIPSFLRREWRNQIFFDAPHTYWLNLPSKEWRQCNWSTDLSEHVGRCHTSMFIAIQIAVYLGFKELYLLGCDMGWKAMPTDAYDPNHFDSGYSFAACLVSQEDADDIQRRHYLAHEKAKEETDSLGIKVYNATEGGSLEVYPRVRLDDVLCRDSTTAAVE